jgi:hypothetical protein
LCRLQFLQHAQQVIDKKQEHPKYENNLLSFGRGLVLTAARDSSGAWGKGSCAANLKLLLAQLERSVLSRQLIAPRAFGGCNIFGRPKSRNWEKLGEARIRRG